MTTSTTGESAGSCRPPEVSARARFPEVTLETVKGMSMPLLARCGYTTRHSARKSTGGIYGTARMVVLLVPGFPLALIVHKRHFMNVPHCCKSLFDRCSDLATIPPEVR